MFNTWLLFSLLALINFGAWGLFTKMATLHISPKSAFIYHVLGILLVTAFALKSANILADYNIKGILFAVLAGTAYALGGLFFFYALEHGKVAAIVTLTALYPAITVILAYFLLQEPLSFKQIVGIGLAIVAIGLLVE